MRHLLVFLLLAATANLFAGVSDIVKESGIRGGIVVHLDCGDGSEIAKLLANDNLAVQGLDSRPEKVEAARALLSSEGIHGRVTASLYDGKKLPYADNLVNLLVAGGKWRVAGDRWRVTNDKWQVTDKEIARVLAPNGVALVPADGSPAPATGHSPLLLFCHWPLATSFTSLVDTKSVMCTPVPGWS